MKSIMKFVAVLAAVFVTASVVLAASEGAAVNPPDPNVNPLTVARALVLKTPDYFRGYLWANFLVGNTFQSKSMQFTMEKSGAITALSIDGDPIPLPEPIFGLPLGDGGLMRDVNLNVNGMTYSGEYAGNGYLQKQVVSKDDSLTVILSPADLKQEIPGDLAQYGNDLELTIDEGLPSGYGYGYGMDNGHFYAYLPPVGGRYHYILRQRSTGAVVGSGWLEPFKSTVTAGDAYVNVTYAGNVKEVKFEDQMGLDSWKSVGNVIFDCLIPTDDGSTVAGKVFFSDIGSGGLEVVLDGQFDVYVQSATSALGDMPFVPLKSHIYDGDGWSETWVSTTSLNVGKVVVIVVPRPENTRENPWGYFHRFYGPVGGGKY